MEYDVFTTQDTNATMNSATFPVTDVISYVYFNYFIRFNNDRKLEIIKPTYEVIIQWGYWHVNLIMKEERVFYMYHQN